MFDSSTTLSLPNVSDVDIFGDDSVAMGFYVLPRLPRIKSDDGTPMIQLLVHGRQTNDGFDVAGGLLSCTTSLSLTEAEQQTVVDALRTTVPEDQALSVHLLPISWAHGTVFLKADALPEMRGSPSLIGGNDCVFQAKLSRGNAEDLRTQWRQEGYQLHVSYRVGVLARVPTDFVIEGVVRGSPSDAETVIRQISSV